MLTPPSHSNARPLLITADPLLLEDLLRVADIAGVQVQVEADAGADPAAWGSAPVVLLGTDAADGVVRRGLPRRPGVLLVGRDLDDANVWHLAVATGAEHVTVLPDANDWLLGRLAQAAVVARRAPVVCVLGGRGGAGASTLAAALGMAAARLGRRCTLLDADPLGGGLDLLLGVEELEGLRWSDLPGERATCSAEELHRALPVLPTHGRGELRLLSADRAIPPENPEIKATAMRTALAAARGRCDLVVVDLPRHPDPAAREALGAGGPVLLVVPAELRATVAAGRVVNALGPGLDLQVVVRGPAPSGLSPAMIAAGLGLPLAGRVRVDRKLAAEAERGTPPGARPGSPWAQFAADWLVRLDALGTGAYGASVHP